MTLAWPVLVLVGLAGWGVVGAQAVRRWGGVDLRTTADLLPLGIAVYLATAGIAVAFDLHTQTFTTAMILAGVCASSAALAARANAPLRSRLGDLSVGSALVGLLLAIALWRAGHFVWNACDDDAAYLYLARRLTEGGDLLDPLNNRRATSLGGMSSLQAAFLSHLRDPALPLADLFLGPLLILVQLWRTRAGKWSVWGIAGALVVTLFPRNLGVENTSPALLAVGLALASYRFAMRMGTATSVDCSDEESVVHAVALTGREVGARGPRAPERPRGGSSTTFDPNPARASGRSLVGMSVVTGLVVAAASAMRPQLAVALVPLAIAAALLPPVRRLVTRRIAGLVAGAVAGLGGWAVASWRAVGTPMFPLGQGNVDPAWPANGSDRPGPTVGDLLGNVADAFTSPEVGLSLLVAAAVVIGLRLTSRGVSDRAGRRAMQVYLLGVGAVALLLAVLGVVWWNAGDLLSFPRFWMPLVVAVAVFPLALVAQTTVAGKRGAALRVGAFAAAAVVTSGAGAWHLDFNSLVADSVSGRSLDAMDADRYERVRADYAEVSAMIEPGSNVLAAADVPSLLLGHGFDVDTLDLLGSTSPAPRLRYFRGAAPKLAWAREHGYDYIVATSPTASMCLYNARRQEANAAGGGVYGAWAPWYLDWFQFLDQVTAASPPGGATATRVGSLIIVEV